MDNPTLSDEEEYEFDGGEEKASEPATEEVTEDDNDGKSGGEKEGGGGQAGVDGNEELRLVVEKSKIPVSSLRNSQDDGQAGTSQKRKGTPMEWLADTPEASPE